MTSNKLSKHDQDFADAMTTKLNKFLRTSNEMHIVSSNNQFLTIFGPRLNKLKMLVKLKIKKNLLKLLSTFKFKVW